MSTRESLASAIAHHRAGRLREAEAIYQSILATHPDHPDTLNLLGALVGQSGRLEDAVALLRQAIAGNPANPDYHLNLAQVLHRGGKLEAARNIYESLLREHPQRAALHMYLGNVLRQQGEPEAAVSAYRRTLALQPNDATAYYNLGATLKSLGRCDEAIDCLRRSLDLAPRRLRVRVNLCAYLLERGDCAGALAQCNTCLEQAPRNTLALAYKAVALSGLGESDAVSTLLGLETLVSAIRIDPPPGYATVEDFNQALARYARGHPSLRADPERLATRFGRQTNELQADGPLVDFRGVAERAIEAYFESLPEDSTHPYLAGHPEAWELVVWAVVLDQRGHQIPHVHGDGWLSGVYYVQLPALETPEGKASGWIEFGRPPAEFPLPATPAVKAIRPEEGLMLLFPSYIYHGTVPLHSAEQRISLAFDVLPKWHERAAGGT